MKKLFAILLAVTMLASMATVASAAENTTTLTTEVPAAEYILNIPADQEIAYGKTSTTIGQTTVTDAKYFAKGKNVNVTITYTEFTSDDVTTTIPFTIECPYGPDDYYTRTITSGGVITFHGKTGGSVEQYAYASSPQGKEFSLTDMKLIVDSEDWGRALAGNYTATITFTAEVVVEE